MNKFTKIGLLGLAIGSVIAPAVHAQDTTEPVNKPVSIKLGVYLPTEGSGRNVGGSTQFAAGVDYAFGKTTGDTPVLPLVYVDYDGGSRNGGHADLYTVGIGVRAYPDRTNDQAVIPFYGVGIGVDFLDANNGNGNSGTKATIGPKVEAGLELNSGPFLEAQYQYVPESSEGVRDSGFNVMIGDRF